MTCPGCDARTSLVLARFLDGEPCPSCGLSAAAAAEVLDARKRGADADLTHRYAVAVKRADLAEAEVARLREKLDRVREALDDDI